MSKIIEELEEAKKEISRSHVSPHISLSAKVQMRDACTMRHIDNAIAEAKVLEKALDVVLFEEGYSGISFRQKKKEAIAKAREQLSEGGE